MAGDCGVEREGGFPSIYVGLIWPLNVSSHCHKTLRTRYSQIIIIRHALKPTLKTRLKSAIYRTAFSVPDGRPRYHDGNKSDPRGRGGIK